MKLSLAVAALLSLVTVKAISSQATSDLSQTSASQVDAYLETDRYIGADGDPIILAETDGHARLVLNKVKKTTHPVPLDVMNVQLDLEECKSKSKGSKAEVEIDEVTHCPIIKKGDKVMAHVQQVNLEDNAYVSDMYVGNPPQKVRGLFDTGSTNTWILNKKVKLPHVQEKQYSFDETASSTFKKSGEAAMIQFGSGSLAGHFVTDDVRLGTCDGTAGAGQVHITGQKFGNVEKQSTIFTGHNFEAIVGLAYPALAEKGVKPVFDEMMEQGLLKNNIFAFYLTTKQADGLGIQSDLTFGYYDKAKYKGEMVWHPIKFKYMFGVHLDDIKVNGKSTGICKDRSEECLITFDSGTSLMSVPPFASQKLMQQKVPLTNYILPCQNQQQFGDLTLVINGIDYTLSNDEWMFPSQPIQMAQGGQKMNFNFGPLGPQVGPHVMAEISHNATFSEIDDLPLSSKSETMIQVDEGIEKAKHKKAKNDQMACASTIMTMEIAKEMFLVGDVFMRKFYTVFDRENDRVGLAQAITSDKVRALNQEPSNSVRP